MDLKDGCSKFNPKIWQLKSEIVKRKASEINRDIEIIIRKYNDKLSETDNIVSNSNEKLSQN